MALIATNTLATTATTGDVGLSDGMVNLASLAGVVPGTHLFIDQELMRVARLGVSVGSGGQVYVVRGIDSRAARHSSSAVVTIGTADQFYDQNPMGVPPIPPVVVPWINTRNGTTWLPQGDETGPDVGARWWQQVVATYAVGALGVRTVTYSPVNV